jgi:hypothetical protein
MPPKLRIVYHSDEFGDPASYFHLEKSEGLRVIAILKLLPQLTEWTPAPEIAKRIKAKLPATLQTLSKLAGAEYIDIELPTSKRKVLAKRPILLLMKEKYNPRNEQTGKKYLRAGVWVRN